MNCQELVDTLRMRDPGALAAVFDNYGRKLYDYCWSLLGDEQAARCALGDTLIVAELHIDELQDALRLRTWLYAIARNECLRRQPDPPGGSGRAVAEQAPAGPAVSTAGPAEPRTVAATALEALRFREREILELTIQHGLPDEDVAAVLGTSTRWVSGVLPQAERQLERAVAAVIVATTGRDDCPKLDRVHGRGEHTATMTELTPARCWEMARHLDHCEPCRSRAPHTVSVAKVLAASPAPTAPPELREEVLNQQADPASLSYRLHVARRAAAFDRTGFPLSASRRYRPGWMWTAGAAVACAAAVPLVAIATSGMTPLTVPYSGPATVGASPSAVAASSHTAPSPSAGTPAGDVAAAAPRVEVTPDSTPVLLWPVPTRSVTVRPTPSRATSVVTVPSSELGSTASSEPGRLEVERQRVRLGSASSARVTLRADGGSVRWQAAESSPALRLSPASGTLDEGATVTVTITVDRAVAASGTAMITFTDDGPTVRVTWSEESPTDSPGSPSRSGSPDPSDSTSSPTRSSASRSELSPQRSHG